MKRERIIQGRERLEYVWHAIIPVRRNYEIAYLSFSLNTGGSTLALTHPHHIRKHYKVRMYQKYGSKIQEVMQEVLDSRVYTRFDTKLCSAS